jgi:hypothetical protein
VLPEKSCRHAAPPNAGFLPISHGELFTACLTPQQAFSLLLNSRHHFTSAFAHPKFNSIPWASGSFRDQLTVTVWRRM